MLYVLLQQEIELSRLRHDGDLKEKNRLARILDDKVVTSYIMFIYFIVKLYEGIPDPKKRICIAILILLLCQICAKLVLRFLTIQRRKCFCRRVQMSLLVLVD